MEKRTPQKQKQKQKHWHVYRGRRNTGAVYRNIIDAIDAFDELLTGERTGSPAVWRECPAGSQGPERGGRRTARRLKNSPDLVHRALPIPVLIHGVARGADAVEGRWARENNVPVSEFPAQRYLHGFAAHAVCPPGRPAIQSRHPEKASPASQDEGRIPMPAVHAGYAYRRFPKTGPGRRNGHRPRETGPERAGRDQGARLLTTPTRSGEEEERALLKLARAERGLLFLGKTARKEYEIRGDSVAVQLNGMGISNLEIRQPRQSVPELPGSPGP